MRGKWPLVILLLLTACGYIGVDDPGAYWDKGVTDPMLVGHWRQERADGIREEHPTEFTIAVEGGEYVISGAKTNDPPILGRTLKAGNYTFFMLDPRLGSEGRTSVLYRYTLRPNVLQLYELDPRDLGDWLLQHCPAQTNLRLGSIPAGTIKTLDDAVVTILFEIPDEERYWSRTDGELQRYRRVQH
jgi:hypothetical protein